MLGFYQYGLYLISRFPVLNGGRPPSTPIQSLFNNQQMFRDDLGNTFFPDDSGDQVREIYKGGSLNIFNNSLLFTDLTGIEIDTLIGTSVPTKVGNEILLTNGYIDHLTFTNGSVLNFEDALGGLLINTCADNTGNGLDAVITGTIYENYTRANYMNISSNQNEIGYNESVSEEKILNGSFDNGLTNWSISAGVVAVFNNKLLVSHTVAGGGVSYSEKVFTVGGNYRVSFKCTVLSGEFYIGDDNADGRADWKNVNATGSYSFPWIPDNDGVLKIKTVGLASFSIDDISVEEFYKYIPALNTPENLALPFNEQVDVLGNVLEFFGKSYYPLQLEASSVIDCNGTDNYINLSVIPTSTIELEIRGIFVESDALIYNGYSEANNNFLLGSADGIFRALLADSAAMITGIPNIGQEVTLKLSPVDGGFYVDNVFFPMAFNNTFTTSNVIIVGGYNVAGFPVSQETNSIRHIKVWDNGVLIKHFTAGEGDGVKLFNKVDGVVTQITGSLTNVWQTSDTQTSYNNINGFDLWEKNTSPGTYARVPFLDNGNSIRTNGDNLNGYSWISRNPGSNIAPNGAENTFIQDQVPQLYDVNKNFDGTVWFGGGAASISYNYSEYQSDYQSKHYWFSDLFSKPPCILSHLVYYEAQSGILLSEIREYTNNLYLRANNSEILTNNSDEPLGFK